MASDSHWFNFMLHCSWLQVMFNFLYQIWGGCQIGPKHTKWSKCLCSWGRLSVDPHPRADWHRTPHMSACAPPHHHLIAGHLARYRPATVDSHPSGIFNPREEDVHQKNVTMTMTNPQMGHWILNHGCNPSIIGVPSGRPLGVNVFVLHGDPRYQSGPTKKCTNSGMLSHSYLSLISWLGRNFDHQCD